MRANLEKNIEKEEMTMTISSRFCSYSSVLSQTNLILVEIFPDKLNNIFRMQVAVQGVDGSG
jgi:hypothetical protein